jgi:hypothetical protein
VLLPGVFVGVILLGIEKTAVVILVFPCSWLVTASDRRIGAKNEVDVKYRPMKLM